MKHTFYLSKQFGILLNFLLLANAVMPLHAGFGAGTLVKTSDSFAQIQDLIVGDYVASYCDDEFLADNIGYLNNNTQANSARVLDGALEIEIGDDGELEDDVSLASGKLLINKVVYLSNITQARAICIVCEDEHIIVSPNQKFYLPLDECWRRAKNLQRGDLLFSLQKGGVAIEDIYEIEQKVDVFDITVEDSHTFFVCEHEILVHNFVPIPVAVAVGFSWAFGCGAVEFAGVSFGIAGIGCVGAGCVRLGSLGINFIKDKIRARKGGCVVGDYNVGVQVGVSCGANNIDIQVGGDCGMGSVDVPVGSDCGVGSVSAQPEASCGANGSKTQENGNGVHKSVPGQPTKDDGFKQPKKWNGETVRHQKKDQWGWLDKKGNLWVPSGATGHGGPHWDIVDKDGNKIDDIFPGGKSR